MKRVLIFSIGLVFVVALSLPAMADVDVTAVIDKTKTKTVTETLNKDKDVLIDVEVIVDLTKAAESEAIVNITNENNTVTSPGGPGNGEENFKESIIDLSILENTGITNVNQGSGNMNNQGNVVSVSVAVDVDGVVDNGLGGFAEAQASVEQDNANNSAYAYQNFLEANREFDPDENVYQRLDQILDSINLNLGITSVNQSAGNMNNQTIATSLAVAMDTMVALSEADLGQYNAFNNVDSHNTTKADFIIGSVNDNRGITNVNQSAGNMNNQGIAISLAATR